MPRRPSPAVQRLPSSERWEHDGAAADAAAAAARVAPAKPASDNQRRQQQSGAAQLASASAQPQTAVQKAAALVPEPAVAAQAGSPHRSRQKEPQADASRRGAVKEDSRHGKEKADSRRSERQGKEDVVRGGSVVAQGRGSGSPAERQQKSLHGGAMSAAGSRWTLLSSLPCVFEWLKVVRQRLTQGRSRTTALQSDRSVVELGFVPDRLCNAHVKPCPHIMSWWRPAPQGVWWDHRRQLTHSSQWDLKRAHTMDVLCSCVSSLSQHMCPSA